MCTCLGGGLSSIIIYNHQVEEGYSSGARYYYHVSRKYILLTAIKTRFFLAKIRTKDEQLTAKKLISQGLMICVRMA